MWYYHYHVFETVCFKDLMIHRYYVQDISINNLTGTHERLFWSFPVISLDANAVISDIYE